MQKGVARSHAIKERSDDWRGFCKVNGAKRRERWQPEQEAGGRIIGTLLA